MKLSDVQLEQLKIMSEILHWLVIADDGVPELYLDHHSMQTFRNCEARFVLEMIEGYGGKGRVWFLDLGICTHKMIEIYYLNRKKSNFNMLKWGSETAQRLWNVMKMDEYATHPIYGADYKKLGGIHGFCALLIQYGQYYNLENERLRVVGTELYFGKAKEVPILSDNTLYDFSPFRLYLTGKIDLLIDDGVAIGPMDHKTSKDFRGKNPLQGYEVQEGMTGYIYAAQHLLKAFPEVQRRQCNKIWMNFLQIKIEDKISDRFKRLPLLKTDFQLEEYRKRQIATASNIFQLLINPDREAQWNGMACNNWMHSPCAFQPVHRQGSRDSQLIILNTNFEKRDIWNPETVDQKERAILDIMKEASV
jgi:PD-(D/E)XK nuclease superfamily